MGKIIRSISEATAKFQTDWRPLDVNFPEDIPNRHLLPEMRVPGEGRTRKTEAKVIGADHPQQVQSTWPVEPLPVTRTKRGETPFVTKPHCWWAHSFSIFARFLTLSCPEMTVHLDLLPPFISRGEGEQFAKTGHKLLLSVSPRDNSISVFAGTVRIHHVQPRQLTNWFSSQVHPMLGESTASCRPETKSGIFCSLVQRKCRRRRDVWCVFRSATASFGTDSQGTVHYRYICYLRGFPETYFGVERERVRRVSPSQSFQFIEAA
jgi:hypothetical protein